MFTNFLRVLGKGKAESVQLLKLWEDVDVADICIGDLPEGGPTLDWLMTTGWYRSGGWEQVRQAAYGPWHEQLDKQYDGTWAAHVEAVKERWVKME